MNEFVSTVVFVLPLLGALIYLDLRRLIMATKAEALAAIQAEAAQVKAKIDALKEIIANRPEVPDDVVAAINAIFEEPAPEPTPEP